MRLFQFPYSPFALKVRLCLQLKGVRAEIVDVPYLDRRDLMKVTGGSVHIPVLQDGGKVIKGSQEITRYLDEAYPPSLRPGNLLAAATIVEQWAESELEDVTFRLAAPGLLEAIPSWNGGREDAAALWRLVKERKYGPGCIEEWHASRKELRVDLEELLEPLGKTLKLQPFLLGDEPTLADAAVWGQLKMVELATHNQGVGLIAHMKEWFARLDEFVGSQDR